MKSGLKLPSQGIRVSEQFDIAPENMLSAVRKQGLEGVIAKRKSSFYEAGKRTGSWVKMRINKAQEFV
jgi:bifunctional non-homologous end joining protein LigD